MDLGVWRCYYFYCCNFSFHMECFTSKIYQSPLIIRTWITNYVLIQSINIQSSTARGYPDQNTMVFFYCLFGSMQCIALSPFLEPNPSAWALQPGVGSIAIVLGAIYSTAFHSNVQTWCLKKKGPLFVAMFSPLSIVIGVILGVTFLGDSLHLGSAIGTVVITAGFYIVMWGQAKEKNMLVVMINEDIVVADELGSSDQNAPLLSCSMESKC
uniref:WAT1-related protein n=1 Tax=Helianthus annuus TaxID=4232 RepID=A0A251RPA8_HELAN